MGDLGEQVEVGRESGDGTVEEDHVLDEQHQLLGHSRAVSEQGLHHPLELPDELVGSHGGGIDHIVEQTEVVSDRVEVGVVG